MYNELGSFFGNYKRHSAAMVGYRSALAFQGSEAMGSGWVGLQADRDPERDDCSVRAASGSSQQHPLPFVIGVATLSVDSMGDAVIRIVLRISISVHVRISIELL